ncbi:Peroxisomal membrane protein PER10 [Vanrija pseudolonga]|uniref:Peroxisomal membrane protein PEX14 n=1 Tax=Vanrija pseudolonga TaxID=143232 RepID=A0AAF0XZA0_9TREE|nr:Peroxisomal membrane protein PER10 [Vanrija pseudolonga]
MAESRQELVRNAVLFLNDPKVQSSSLTQRIEFLQGKGLSEPEIQQALHEAANPGAASAPAAASLTSPVAAPPAYARSTAAPQYAPAQQGGYVPYGNVYAVPPPEPPKRDWRDVFIMAVVSGGVVYGLAALARKYLTPHLQPPSSTAFQETSQALTEQYDAAAAALADLKAETEALSKSTEAERARLSAALDEVEEAARAVRDAETRWRDDMREVRGEVESVRELVPRMIEKHSAAQSAALTELQSELRSLKTLLVARQGGAAAPAQPATPATEGGSGAASPTPSATQTAANALLAPRGKASIPAWQLAPSASASNGASASSNASTGTSTTSSPRAETA